MDYSPRTFGPGLLLAGLLGAAKDRADASMMHLVQSLGLPHLLMLAGALLVIAGCFGLAISRKKAAEIDDELVNDAEPPPQSANGTRG